MEEAVEEHSLSTQNMANDKTLAKRTSAVCSVWPRWCVWPTCRATEAPMIEKAMPTAATAQNGITSFLRWERPDFPQAQFRLSQYDGKVATALAKMVLGTSVHHWKTPIDESEDADGHAGRDDRDHRVTEDLLPLVGMEPCPEALEQFGHIRTTVLGGPRNLVRGRPQTGAGDRSVARGRPMVGRRRSAEDVVPGHLPEPGGARLGAALEGLAVDGDEAELGSVAEAHSKLSSRLQTK